MACIPKERTNEVTTRRASEGTNEMLRDRNKCPVLITKAKGRKNELKNGITNERRKDGYIYISKERTRGEDRERERNRGI